MRVQVFEQWRGGHYFNYLECLLPRLSALVDEVVVTMTPFALKSAEFEAKLGSCRSLPNVRFEGGVPGADPALPLGERLQLLLNLRDAVARTRPDYLLVPSADAQTLAMGALGHLGVSLLPKGLPSEATFHCGYGPAIASARHVLKEAVYRLAYSGCTWSRLNFVNFLYFEHALGRGCRWSGRARLVPDPVPQAPRLTSCEARRLLGIPEEGRYLGLLGSLDARKAIPEMLAAFRTARLGAQDRLLLAGRLDSVFRKLIADEYQDLIRCEKLVVLDRFLGEDELLQGYGALDLVCVAYRDFPGLASLMLKGLAAGRPVLANDFGWSGALVRRFGVGRAARISDPVRFAGAMREALDASADYSESEATKRLLAFHDIGNFADSMLDGVGLAAGKPGADRPVSWNWVLEALDPAGTSVDRPGSAPQLSSASSRSQ